MTSQPINRLIEAAHKASELMDGAPDDDVLAAASTELSEAAAAVSADVPPVPPQVQAATKPAVDDVMVLLVPIGDLIAKHHDHAAWGKYMLVYNAVTALAAHKAAQADEIRRLSNILHSHEAQIVRMTAENKALLDGLSDLVENTSGICEGAYGDDLDAKFTVARRLLAP